MAQVVLDRPRVLAVVCQLIATAMTKHVAVDEEGEARCFAGARSHALIARHAQRGQTLGHKHIGAGGRLTL